MPSQRHVSTCSCTAANVSVCDDGIDARLGAVRDARLALDEPGRVLAAHRVDVGIDAVHRLQHLDLVVADHLRVPERGRFHGDVP